MEPFSSRPGCLPWDAPALCHAAQAAHERVGPGRCDKWTEWENDASPLSVAQQGLLDTNNVYFMKIVHKDAFFFRLSWPVFFCRITRGTQKGKARRRAWRRSCAPTDSSFDPADWRHGFPVTWRGKKSTISYHFHVYQHANFRQGISWSQKWPSVATRGFPLWLGVWGGHNDLWLTCHGYISSPTHQPLSGMRPRMVLRQLWECWSRRETRVKCRPWRPG